MSAPPLARSEKRCPTCYGTGRAPDWEAIGSTLREQRIAKGLSMLEVAVRMNLSESYLSELEKGRRPFHPGLRKLYLAALDAPPGTTKVPPRRRSVPRPKPVPEYED